MEPANFDLQLTKPDLAICFQPTQLANYCKNTVEISRKPMSDWQNQHAAAIVNLSIRTYIAPDSLNIKRG